MDSALSLLRRCLFSARTSDLDALAERLQKQGIACLDAMEEWEGTTALACAVRERHYLLTRLLLVHGADPNERAPVLETGANSARASLIASRSPILYHAWATPYLAIFQLLLEHGADPNAAPDLAGGLLYLAAVHDDDHFVEALRAAGAEPIGAHALLTASAFEAEPAFRGRLALHPNPSETDATGWTPLHYAARYNNAANLQALLEHGAAPEPTDTLGQTPLHLAAREGHIGPARVLLAHRACLDRPTCHGHTPRDLALEDEHLAFVDFLDTYRCAQRLRAPNRARAEASDGVIVL